MLPRNTNQERRKKIRTVIEGEKGGSILEFAGAWKGEDIDRVFSIVQKDREKATSRNIEI